MKTPLLFALLVALLAGPALAADIPPAELPPAVRAFTANGVVIEKTMPAPEGFKGYVGQIQGNRIPVYLLPDGQHVIVGSIYDAGGADLSTTAFREASTPEYGDAEWQQLENATWIPEGASAPERIVYAFTDTECPYCHRLWEQTRPLLADGKTQIRHVIVAVISPTKSAPRAAAVLGAKDPAGAFQQHEENFGHSPFAESGQVPADIRAQLNANGELMRRLGAHGTPALVYRDREGKVRLFGGVPPDAATLRAIIFGG